MSEQLKSLALFSTADLEKLQQEFPDRVEDGERDPKTNLGNELMGLPEPELN